VTQRLLGALSSLFQRKLSKGRKMKKILIVDDNQDNRLTLKLLLRSFDDLDVQEAKNGREALVACATTKYNIVFMDIMMPEMDGTQATSEICKFDKNVMIIAVSALSDSENKQAIMEAGAEDYITKPINPEYFKDRMETYLRLSALRHHKSFKLDKINLFEIPVFSRNITFSIEKECDLAEFWSYYLVDGHNTSDAISDYIRCFYNIGLAILKENEFFKIIVEEDEKNYYYSFVNLRIANEQKIHEIIKKELGSPKYCIDIGKISVIVPKTRAVPVVKKSLSVETEKKLNELLMHSDNASVQNIYDTHIRKVSAFEFLNEHAFNVSDKAESLELLEYEIEKVIFKYEANKDISLICELSKTVTEYASILDSLYEFGNLAEAIKSLGTFFGALDKEMLDDKKRFILVLLMGSVVQDLKEWRKTIFIDQNTADIHYLDHSLLSSCVQIELLVKYEGQETNSEFELF
jgi:CheY-like chemotaxis protein